MAAYHFIEDPAYIDKEKSALRCGYPFALDVLSSVELRDLNKTPPDNIAAGTCNPGGWVITAPIEKSPSGISRHRVMFLVTPEERKDFSDATRFARYDHIPGKGAEFVAISCDGALAPVEKRLSFSDSGHEVTMCLMPANDAEPVGAVRPCYTERHLVLDDLAA